MTIRRQKNISKALNALERAFERREMLLAQLVRNERLIRLLRQRSMRAQKAYVAKGDASVAAGEAPSPFRADREIPGELNDDIVIGGEPT